MALLCLASSLGDYPSLGAEGQSVTMQRIKVKVKPEAPGPSWTMNISIAGRFRLNVHCFMIEHT